MIPLLVSLARKAVGKRDDFAVKVAALESARAMAGHVRFGREMLRLIEREMGGGEC
jgi:hypothetical protein